MEKEKERKIGRKSAVRKSDLCHEEELAGSFSRAAFSLCSLLYPFSLRSLSTRSVFRASKFIFSRRGDLNLRGKEIGNKRQCALLCKKKRERRRRKRIEKRSFYCENSRVKIDQLLTWKLASNSCFFFFLCKFEVASASRSLATRHL